MARHGTQGYAAERIPLEPLLTVADVCKLLAVSKQTLYRLLRAGELTPSRVGDRLRFRPDDVRAYLERNREEVASP
jgi:excisionase family DNA binding protein